jgi:hypothetical protein
LARLYAENDLLSVGGHLCERKLADIDRRQRAIPSHGNDAG